MVDCPSTFSLIKPMNTGFGFKQVITSNSTETLLEHQIEDYKSQLASAAMDKALLTKLQTKY